MNELLVGQSSIAPIRNIRIKPIHNHIQIQWRAKQYHLHKEDKESKEEVVDAKEKAKEEAKEEEKEEEEKKKKKKKEDEKEQKTASRKKIYKHRKKRQCWWIPLLQAQRCT